MANLFEHKDRRVIPNWRSFNETTVLGELNSYQANYAFPSIETNIVDYIIDWQKNKSIIYASDLLSAAIVNNKKDNSNVIDAANFIIANKNKASKSQISLAYQILGKTIINDLSSKFLDLDLDRIPSLVNIEIIRNKIRNIKLQINSFPYNPILYVELSRFYSIIGQEDQSINAMQTALHLAPNNRFVLRSATRLFAHFNDADNFYLEYIHNILRKSPITGIDPWLTSAEISISTIRDRTSKFIKIGLGIINSKNISPFNFTELASSIGTVELLNGGTKKSRDLFNKALINPNDNSLAQIEWASRKDNQLDINPSHFDVKMNFEALALDNFHNNKFDLALDNAVKWFIDMPFSKRPIMFGSNIATSILKDQAKSISFLNAGLISHPNDPQLLNNLAYSLALDDKPTEANIQLDKIRNVSEYDEVTNICLTATKGLTYFRNGQFDLGRRFYIDAIERTNLIKNQELNWIAILNYAREEILINSDQIVNVMDVVSKIPKECKDIEVKILRKDVMDLFEKNKQVNQ